MSKVDTIKFIGGPRDGECVENGIGFVPDVINGDNEIHLFGNNAYAVVKIDHDTGIAYFEHMRLVNSENIVDGS